MSSTPDEDWKGRRREAADVKAQALARTQAEESRQAGEMLIRFVADATAAGIAPSVLYARSFPGSARYRTDAIGWCLKHDGSVAVGQDGQYYVLRAPRSWRARLRGVHVEPTAPPLIVGKGGRDGESIDLRDLLRLRLAAGNEW